jgi:hypothetical protein
MRKLLVAGASALALYSGSVSAASPGVGAYYSAYGGSSAGALSPELIDALRSKIRPCVNSVPGASGAVDLSIRLESAGQPIVKVLGSGDFYSDPAYRRVAEMGAKAFMNPRCSISDVLPWDGTLDHLWIVFRFDPKEY